MNIIKTDCKKSFGLRSCMNIAVEVYQYVNIIINHYKNIRYFKKALLKLI